MKNPAWLAAWVGFVLAAWLGAAGAQETAGAELARRLGCFACHGQGRDYAAKPLNGVAARLSCEQLQVVLTQPRKLYPGAKMPSYAYLPDAERRALLDFMESLK